MWFFNGLTPIKRNLMHLVASVAMVDVVMWMTASAMPLLVLYRFPSNSALIGTALSRILPRMLCAPWIAAMIQRKGSRYTANMAMTGLIVGYLSLTQVTHYTVFLGINLCIGVFGMAVDASFLVLRSNVISPGNNIAVNTFFSSVERLSGILGPILAGLFLHYFNVIQCLCVTACLLGVCLIQLLLNHALSDTIAERAEKTAGCGSSYLALLKLFCAKPKLWSIFLPLLGSSVVLGALNLFLLWSNQTLFLQPGERWMLLLTTKALGSFCGSLYTKPMIQLLSKRLSMLSIYLFMNSLRGLALVALTWITHFKWALFCMFLIGLPEVTGSVCFFTMIQQDLTKEEGGLFHSLSLPVYYATSMVGSLLGGLYTGQWVGLQTFWMISVGLFMAPTFLSLCCILRRQMQRRPVTGKTITRL